MSCAGAGSFSVTQTLRPGSGCPLLPLPFRSKAAWFGLAGTAQCHGEMGEQRAIPPLTVSAAPGLSSSTACLWVSDTPSPAGVGAVVALSSKNLAGEAGNPVVGTAAGAFSSLAAWLLWVKDVG